MHTAVRILLLLSFVPSEALHGAVSKTVFYDTIIVGAGVIGSSTAYNLAQRGRRSTLVLEESDNALEAEVSSNGAVRISRNVSLEHPEYTALNTRSFEMVAALQKQARTVLLEPQDLVSVYSPFSSTIHRTLAKCREMEARCTHLKSSQAIHAVYPYLGLHSDSEFQAVVEHASSGTGIIMAAKMIRLLRGEARKVGVSFHFGESLEAFSLIDGGVQVETRRGTYLCKKLVFATGGATARFLDLPLRSIPQIVYNTELPGHWPRDYPMLYVESFPGLPQHGFYALREGSTVRFAFHVIDETLPYPNLAEVDYLFSHLFQRPKQLSKMHGCFYTVTPDKKPVLGPMSAYRNRVIVGAGFQGNGFKMALGVGEVLGSYVVDDSSADRYAAFSPNRFQHTTTSVASRT